MSITDTLKQRRSQYALGKSVDNGDAVIAEIKDTVRNVPTAFHTQSGRLLILTGDAQEKLWGEIVPTDLKAEMDRQGVPEAAWENTAKKLEGFRAAYGTVLFFEDQDTVEKYQADFPLYADNFPVWSEQVSGSATLAVWIKLTELGLGANLQHYNPVIDETVKKTWNLPDSWKLRGEMLFGNMEDAVTGEQEKLSDDGRFIVAN